MSMAKKKYLSYVFTKLHIEERETEKNSFSKKKIMYNANESEKDIEKEKKNSF